MVGEIKQRQTASLSRDGATDKDLSMAHFHGTEGWKEGGRDEGRKKGEFKFKLLWIRGPKFSRVAEKLLQDKQASPIEICSFEAGCLARNLGNGADSSKKLLPSGYLSKTTPPKNIPPSACQSCRGAERVVLAQAQVDDPQDTDLQEHEKALHGRTPFIRANSTIMVPQVEVKY